jgi:acrylyl-CoA reductase (NADPH)
VSGDLFPLTHLSAPISRTQRRQAGAESPKLTRFPMSFQAFVLDCVEDEPTGRIRRLDVDDLPDADTLLDVAYSSLNYKDALAVTGAGNIIRGDFPIVPGIDLVGRVVETDGDRFSVGDAVIGTGWQLGEVVWGGYTQRARVDAERLVPLPTDLTAEQAMTIGTAGLTAMLSVMALEEHGVDPAEGEVLVTGASGGAGGMAVAILRALGYTTVASTGSEDAHVYLSDLGADRIVERGAFDSGPSRPMESGRWAGAVDAVGGSTLATIIAQLQRHGSVAAFGNAGGHELHTTVLPFILRGVNLLGIDSNTCPNPRRTTAWERIASVLDPAVINRMRARTIGLSALPDAAAEVLDGAVRGRILVDVDEA